jgi:hypothetical protein
MIINARLLYFFIVLVSVTTFCLVGFAWVRLKARPNRSAGELVCLLAITISYLWLMLGYFFAPLLGQSYTNTRYLIIDVNCVGGLLCMAMAIFAFGYVRRLQALAALLTSLLWTITGLI